MAIFPGYVAPQNLWLDAGVLYYGATPLGASRDGFQFDPGMDIRNVPFDGQHAPNATLDRIITWKPIIKGKMVEATQSVINTIYEVGSTSSSITGGYAIVPKSAGQLFIAGNYITDLFLIGRMQGTQVIKIHIPVALVEKYALAAKPHNEGEWDVQFGCRVAVGANLESPPYEIQVLT